MPDEDYERGIQFGIERERIHQRFARLEERVGSQEKLVQSLSASIEGLNRAVQRFEASIERREAVDEALVNKQLTARQFYIGLGGVLAAFGLILVTILTALH